MKYRPLLLLRAMKDTSLSLVCDRRMKQDNATASWHVDETVSIVPKIGVVITHEVLRQHNGICKGWAIIIGILHV
jgi:hypothetical protein